MTAVSLLVLAMIAFGGSLYYLRDVLIPFVLAVFLTIGMTPLVDVQRRTLRLPRTVAIITTFAVALVFLVLIGVVVTASVNQMVDNADVYQQQLRNLTDSVMDKLPLEDWGVDRKNISSTMLDVPIDRVQKLLLSTTNAILKLLSQGVMVLIFMGFLLFGNQRSKPLGGLLGEVSRRTRKYIVNLFVISAGTGIGVGLTLWLLGVDLALVFGLLAFLLNFIPSIGSIVATLLPVPVVLMSPDIAPWAAVLAIAIPAGIQFVLGNVIQPRIMGQSFDLHPVVVLLALIFWGALWGVVGMFLATPITAVVRIILARHPVTYPVAEAMAGRLDAWEQDDSAGEHS